MRSASSTRNASSASARDLDWGDPRAKTRSCFHDTRLVDELKQADTILLGPPLYNFGAPSSVKAWVDHVVAWLPHGLALTGLQHRFIVGELTPAEVTPAMSEFIPLARKSRTDAERAVDELWGRRRWPPSQGDESSSDGAALV